MFEKVPHYGHLLLYLNIKQFLESLVLYLKVQFKSVLKE